MTADRDALVEKMKEKLWTVWDCLEEDDDRMRVYASALLNIAMEEAARVAEAHEDDMGHGKGSQIAAAIRAYISDSGSAS